MCTGSQKLTGMFARLTSVCASQRVFINSLGRDYARWASDSVYRDERKAWAAQSDLASGQGQLV